MTPVLVFLTDKTLYVTDLVRNRLCNKFVLPYTELDVILVRNIIVRRFFTNFEKFHSFIMYLIGWTAWKYCATEQ